MNTIFSEIDGERRKQALTVFALCRQAGIPVSTWWRVATGKQRKWNARTVTRLRSGLGGQLLQVMEEDRSPLVAATYRGALAHLAQEFGEDPVKVARRPTARGYWKIRALALWCVSVEFDIRGAELGRALGVSKQVVSWNLKQANKLQDDPAIRGRVERAGQVLAAREELPE